MWNVACVRIFHMALTATVLISIFPWKRLQRKLHRQILSLTGLWLCSFTAVRGEVVTRTCMDYWHHSWLTTFRPLSSVLTTPSILRYSLSVCMFICWKDDKTHICTFYPRDAMLARVIVIATCASVTRRYCVKTKKASGMISSPSGSPKTLVF